MSKMKMYRVRLLPTKSAEILDGVANNMEHVEFFARGESEEAARNLVSRNAAKASLRLADGDMSDDPWISSEWSACEPVESVAGTSGDLEYLDCVEETVGGWRAQIVSYCRHT